MAGDTEEGIQVDAGTAEEVVPAAGGGEETKRKRGRPKGSFKKKKKKEEETTQRSRRARAGDHALASPAISPGDLVRGVAAGPRALRERKPAPNAFYERDTDTEVRGFSSCS
jgi:lysine-specific demethylase 3